jgi:hypothetical protein
MKARLVNLDVKYFHGLVDPQYLIAYTSRQRHDAIRRLRYVEP